MTRGAAVDRRTATVGVLGDMWGHTKPAHFGDEVLRVKQLVRAHGDPATGRKITEHARGRLALGGSGGVRQLRIHHQAVAVLHQQVSHVAELRGLAGRFPEQPSVGIGGRGVRRVAPLLAMKVAFTVAAWRGRLAAAVLRAEALDAGPRFYERAIDL